MLFLLSHITYKLTGPKLYLCLSLTLFSFFSFAQLNNNWYLSKILNDNNGLPQNSVRSLYFDKRTGFLWLTTEAGLVRYDGVNARVFDLRDLPSLKSIRMFYLFPSLQGDVLGSNRLGEIFAIKNNFPVNMYGYRINDFSVDFSLRKRNVRSIKDLNFENDINHRTMDGNEPVSNSLWLNENSWLGVSESFIDFFENEKLVYQWPKENKDDVTLIPRNGFVYALYSNASGNCINLINKTIVSTTAGSKVLTEGKPLLFYDKLNDQPLLLNNNNLYKLEFKANKIFAEFIAALKGLPTDITSVILHSNKKMVFVSTNTAGVYLYHLSPFRVYKSGNDDIPNNNYASVLTDSSHIFTCHSLLFDLNTGNSRKIPVPINHTLSMGLDVSKNIWTATEGNVISFRIQEPQKINKYPVTKDNYLRTFFLTRKGKFWISTGKFLGFEQDKELREYIPFENNIDSSSFYYLTETSGGKLVGVSNKGIYFIDTIAKRFIPVLLSDQISDVRNMNIDSNNLWWITTYGKGIFLFKPEENKLLKLPVDEKGYLLYSHACINDGQNNFLVPTNKGLFRINRDNLLQISAMPQTPLLYQYFDVSDGLSTNEFNGGCQPAFNRLPNGDIMLPALQGLVKVRENELPSPHAYPLFIDEIETKSKKYMTGPDIHFNKDERTQNWHLHFAEWDQTNSRNIFYRTDQDSSWQRLPVGERKIQLNELTGGDHFLEIKYQYGLLQHQFSSLQFKFYIGKKYYETVWFWLSVFVLFALIISLIIRIRILRRALNMQTLRNHISADMHDEIGSTLSSISFYSQALLIQTNDEKHKKVLEKIKENAQIAQEGMSDIIWSVKGSMDGMENVFNRMQSFGTEFLESKEIYFHLETDKQLSSQKMRMAHRKNFYLIFKEAVHNAAKYSECKNIWVKIESAAPHLLMIIKDDGKGFDVHHPKNGNGLSNMHKRASQMKGRLSVDSSCTLGTTVTLVF